jgi:lipopolysaccharide/colanic/teichoic acid biosynthesis glycosyltransferase
MTMQQNSTIDQRIIDLRTVEEALPRERLRRRGGLPVVPLKDRDTFYARHGKAAFDRFSAAVLLLLASPVLLVVTLLVLARLGRPVLITQPRVGRGGNAFGMLKFRTMHPDRRERRESFRGGERRRTHKSPHDPRHTPLGRVLRKLSLDELPQLWNIVRGDMSIVGPRPELVHVVLDRYEPWQHGRHAVRPGLTGLWQTTARDIGLMHEHIHLDLEYIRRMSFGTDVKLLFKTVGVLVRPKTQ